MLLIDRVIPSRRGAPVSFHIRPLKTPEDCALAYTDLLDVPERAVLTAMGPGFTASCASLTRAA